MSILLDDAGSEGLEFNTTPVTVAPFTIACWGNADASAINATLIGLSDTGSADNYWQLRFDNTGKLAWFVNDSGNLTNYKSTASFSTDTWHHCCIVEASSTSRILYFDGVAETANTDDRTPDGADTISIGQRTTSGANAHFWSGHAFWAAVYNIALIADEVAMLARGVHPYRVRRDGLVSFGPLEGDAHHDNIQDIDVSTVNGSPIVSPNPPGVDHLRFRHRRMLGSKVLR